MLSRVSHWFRRGRHPMATGGKLWLCCLLVGLAAIGVAAGGPPAGGPDDPALDPYRQSWQADAHGAKLKVACAACHVPESEAAGGAVPRASHRRQPRVTNAGCLASGCHGDLQFMDRPLQVGTVKFTHAEHLAAGEAASTALATALDEVRRELQQALGDEVWPAVARISQEAGPAADRLERMTELARSTGRPLDRAPLVRLNELEHRAVRNAQLRDLQCAHCHAQVRPHLGAEEQGKHHFAVNQTTCYTCHFHNESFNTGTGSCLMCHTLPTTDLTVHPKFQGATEEKLGTPELAVQTIKMNHTAFLERNVDCVACHADVALEDIKVARRDCERCHNQARYFAAGNPPWTLELAQKYHQLHVPQQHARCLDCHAEIQHQLVPSDMERPDRGFLAAAISNCQHCHPSQHQEQIQLLLGRGGQAALEAEPNLMFGSRTNCYGCHTAAHTGADGQAAVDVAQAACVACHGDKHLKTFGRWRNSLKVTLADAETALAEAQQALADAAKVSADVRSQATQLLAAAAADLRLVQNGKGLHHITYAMDLLDAVTTRCEEAVALLTGDLP